MPLPRSVSGDGRSAGGSMGGSIDQISNGPRNSASSKFYSVSCLPGNDDELEALAHESRAPALDRERSKLGHF